MRSNPFDRRARRKTPQMAPDTFPFPPNRDTPPMQIAATDVSVNWAPRVGGPELAREERTTPQIPLRRPEIVKARTWCFLMSIPESLAALGFPPIA